MTPEQQLKEFTSVKRPISNSHGSIDSRESKESRAE